MLEDASNKFLAPTIFSPLKIIPEEIIITSLKERIRCELATTCHASCNPKGTAARPRIIPVQPPIVSMDKKRSPK